MKIICVDDEPLILEMVVSLCREYDGVESVEGFSRAEDAADYYAKNGADVALLDIDMPGTDGLTLAKRLKEINPDVAVIFLTGYAQYAVDAVAMHASGYLLKPISRERLAAELDYAMSGKVSPSSSRITVRTFGNFDISVDGSTVVFSRSKAKELLAYLVDRQGRSVTRAEVFAALWENGMYDRRMQKQLDVIIRSMRASLRDAGIADILEVKSGSLKVRADMIDCDLYRFLKGEPAAVNAYRGEYMSSYSWANMTEAYMTGNKAGRK